ncbi:hypothetical protein [Aminipila sp.]|uniref:hypothetical protein n=1 Tax=Aminipila sp. TaxID=2060095 RepID=UPI002897E177|nr:hypothetical protein [Aminipila sp.]
MDAYLNKIYEMMYLPIVSPYNLLENAKIDNYSYVKYYNSDEGLIAEMKCDVPREGEKTFYYHFDKKDYLKKIYMEVDGIKEIVFDRNKAIQEAKSEYFALRSQYDEAI